MNNRKNFICQATVLWISFIPIAAASQEDMTGKFTGDVNTLRKEVIEVLSERERAAADRLSPASDELIAIRNELRKTTIDDGIVKWQKDTLEYFLSQMQNASPQAGFEIPAGEALLDVVLVRLNIDLTQDVENGKTASFKNGQTAIQVARSGNPEKSIIWTAESGYTAIPSDYLSIYVPESSNPVPLNIGGDENEYPQETCRICSSFFYDLWRILCIFSNESKCCGSRS